MKGDIWKYDIPGSRFICFNNSANTFQGRKINFKLGGKAVILLRFCLIILWMLFIFTRRTIMPFRLH